MRRIARSDRLTLRNERDTPYLADWQHSMLAARRYFSPEVAASARWHLGHLLKLAGTLAAFVRSFDNVLSLMRFGEQRTCAARRNERGAHAQPEPPTRNLHIGAVHAVEETGPLAPGSGERAL